MRALLLSTLLATAAFPALADDTTGQIIAFDRVANVLVLDDKTIWQLDANTAIPEALVAGEKVILTFTSTGENGIGMVTGVVRADN